jgi:hypothetical protein
MDQTVFAQSERVAQLGHGFCHQIGLNAEDVAPGRRQQVGQGLLVGVALGVVHLVQHVRSGLNRLAVHGQQF